MLKYDFNSNSMIRINNKLNQFLCDTSQLRLLLSTIPLSIFIQSLCVVIFQNNRDLTFYFFTILIYEVFKFFAFFVFVIKFWNFEKKWICVEIYWNFVLILILFFWILFLKKKISFLDLKILNLLCLVLQVLNFINGIKKNVNWIIWLKIFTNFLQVF